MPIIGFTDRQKIDTRQTSVGKLHKGKRLGFGKNIKLTDEDYLVFTAHAGEDDINQMVEGIFMQVYDATPKKIHPVYLTVDLLGNFDIQACAWLTASKHTERGSILMGVSDGQNVKKMRNTQGKGMDFFYDGELTHEEVTKTNPKGDDCLSYNGKLYPWQPSFGVDIFMPDFDEALRQAGILLRGNVRLTTTSWYDISTLIDEFESMMSEAATVFFSPYDDHFEMKKSRLPLREIPLMVYRKMGKINAPNYHSENPADRIVQEKSLLHWKLDPDFEAMAEQTRQERRQLVLQAAAGLHAAQLNAPPPAQIVASLNDDLFGAPLPERTTPEPSEQPEPSMESTELNPLADIEDGEFEEEPDVIEEEETAVEDTNTVDTNMVDTNLTNTDWIAKMDEAQNLDHWSAYFWNVAGVRNVFKDANQIKRGVIHMLGEHFDPRDNVIRREAMMKYVNAKADKAPHEQAMTVAKNYYTQASVPF